MINYLKLSDLTPEHRAKLLRRTEDDLGPFLEKVQPIIEAVRVEGDVALARFAKAFDKSPVTADQIAATPADFAEAHKLIATDLQNAIAFAARNIRNFHQAQMPGTEWRTEVLPGVFAGDRTLPIPSVACYIPRGKGSFPSSVLMTCIPAQVAAL